MGGGLGVERLSKKEKGLLDMDNSLVIARGEGGIRGLKGNVKKYSKKLKKKNNYHMIQEFHSWV